MAEGPQAEGAQAKPKRVTQSRLRLCGELCQRPINRSLFRQKLLLNFKFSYYQYEWIIGTYHPYKKVRSARILANLNKLSFITDKMRKYYHKDTIIFVTKERSEDHIPHYHVLLGFKRIKRTPGDPPLYHSRPFLQIRNAKEWSSPWSLGCNFSVRHSRRIYNEDGEEAFELLYTMSAFHPGIGEHVVVDLGAKQRWFRYGMHRYLLYMLKYSKFIRYEDYFLFNIKI